MSLGPLIESMARVWLNHAWAVSLQAAAAIVLVALMTVALRKMAPRVRYAMWLIVLVRLAIPIALSTPVGWLASAELVASPAQLWNVVAPPGRAGDAGTSSVAAGPVRVAITLMLLWAGTVALSGAAALVRGARARRALARCPEAGPALHDRLSRWARSIGLKRTPALRIVPEGMLAHGPAVFGLRRPVVLLPERMATTWDTADLEPVLLHELTHLRRRDHLVNAVQVAVQVIFFFHPLVWLANRRIRIERELACDDAAVRAWGSAAPYARALVRVAEDRHGGRGRLRGIGISERAGSLHRRIERMSGPHFEQSLHRSSITRLAVIGAAALGVLGVVSATDRPVSTASAASEPLLPGQDGVTEPEPISRVAPIYPEKAREERIEGKLVLRAVITTEGTCRDIEPLKVPAPEMGFEESGIEAVSQWRFKPATKDGEPVEAYFTVVIQYKLEPQDSENAEDDENAPPA